MGKQKSSAFWWFMVHLQKEEYYKTKKLLSIPQVSGPAGDKWKKMSPEERKPFIDKDKEYKAGERYPLRDFAQEMANRKVKVEPSSIKPDPDVPISRPESRSSSASVIVTVEQCRRKKLTDSLRKFIESADDERIINQKFYFIASNVLCATRKEVEGSDECVYEDTYYPMEIGIAEWCISEGITFFINKFTDPGKTPTAMARVVKEHAKKHEIETSDLSVAIGCTKDLLTGEYDMDKRRKEFDDLVCDLHDIFNNSIIDEVYIDEGKAVKIIFSEADQIWQNKGCLKKIAQEAGLERFTEGIEVLDCADLFFFLSLKKGYGIKPLLLDMLDGSKYDYDGRCDYHTNKDTRYCALTVAKKHCWLISEHLCKLYEVEVKPEHLPLELRSAPVIEEDDWCNFNKEITTSKFPQRRRYFDEDFDEPARPVSETNTISWPTSVGRGSARNLPSDNTSFKREAPSPRNGTHSFPATDVRLIEGTLKAEPSVTPSTSSSSGHSNGDHLPRLPGQEPCTSPFRSRDDRNNGSSNNGDVKPSVPDIPRPLGRGRARQSRPNF